MKLICAGLPKTGTKSVATALRILGYNVHDIEEHWSINLDKYIDALEGRQMPDFATMYASVDAVTDNPACYFWEEIFIAFPDAKVILMVRDDGEAWVESYKKTISIVNFFFSSLWMRLGLLCVPAARKWKRFILGCRKKLGWMNPVGMVNPVVTADTYTKHNARVKESIPQDQLLVYNVKQGWKPLCKFLGVEVPDVPFPQLNVQSNYIQIGMKNSYIYKKISAELAVILTLIVLVGAVLVYQIF